MLQQLGNVICTDAQVLGKDCRAVPAGGASEMEIARHLQADARKATGLEQYAIAKYAEALEVRLACAAVSSRDVDACQAPGQGSRLC